MPCMLPFCPSYYYDLIYLYPSYVDRCRKIAFFRAYADGSLPRGVFQQHSIHRCPALISLCLALEPVVCSTINASVPIPMHVINQNI